MLAKPFRLTKQKDFEAVLAKDSQAQVFINRNMVVKCLPNEKHNSRFGVIVSLKVAKKVVARNRIKRQLREVIQQHLPEIKAGYDLVIIARLPIMNQEFKQLDQQFLQTIKFLKLVK